MATLKYSLELLQKIKELRNQRFTFDEIADKLNQENYSHTDFTASMINNAYNRYVKSYIDDEEEMMKQLSKSARSSKTSQVLRKQQKILLTNRMSFEDMEIALKELVKEIKPSKVNLNKKKKKDRSKRDMTIELNLSDIHYGKKVEVVNDNGDRVTLCDKDIIRKRIDQFMDVFEEDLKMQQKTFNVEKIVVNLIGDIIESFTMHNLESAISCEFGNSRQIVEAISSLHNQVISRIAKLNIPVLVNCVTGNHDRTEISKTYNNSGENNVSFQIYKVLEMMCENLNLKHVKFCIPVKNYLIFDIYGSNCLVEHGDQLKNKNQQTIENLVSKRANQNRCHITFSRWGHFHEYTVFGRGNHIINGSVPGQDSYAEVLGFDSQACQVINYYIKTKNRPTPFYKSFPVYLD